MSKQLTENDFLKVGKIVGVHGIKGWSKVYAFTDPRENLLAYASFHSKLKSDWRQLELVDFQAVVDKKPLILRFKDIEDRNQAELLIGSELYIRAEHLPKLNEDEFYWNQLIGCQVSMSAIDDPSVVNLGIGKVVDLIETGQHDVLVVEDKSGQRRLIPFIDQVYIRDVNLGLQSIQVNWFLNEDD